MFIAIISLSWNIFEDLFCHVLYYAKDAGVRLFLNTSSLIDRSSVLIPNFNATQIVTLAFLSGLQQICNLNIKPMVGSAWVDLSRTALVSDENSFVATGKDLPLLVVVFANLQEAIAVIWRDVCTTLLYLLKSRLFYLCLLMLIAAPKPTYDSPLHLRSEVKWSESEWRIFLSPISLKIGSVVVQDK